MPTAFELVCRTTRAFYGLFLDTPPFLESAREFPGAERLEAGWQDMRAEALDVLRGARDVPRFHELLDPVRVHATQERERAPSRASLFKHMTEGDDNELAGMGYLDSGGPVEVTSKLCLDGCFAAPPSDSDSD